MKANYSENTQVALVTGGARRLGAALVRALAAQGWQLLIHAHSSRIPAEQLCRELRAAHAPPPHLLSANLSSTAAVERLWQESLDCLGRVDAIINNAALFEKQPLLNATSRDFERHWRVNTLAPITLTQLFARHLKAQERTGQVINLLDQRLTRCDPLATPYLLSKQSLAEYTRSAALSFAPYLRVNAVAPGALLAPEAPAAREMAGLFPMGARPTTHDLTEAVSYLLKAQSVTGQILFVDGGQHLVGGGG